MLIESARKRLEGVHPDIVRVANRVSEIYPGDWTILPGGGVRSTVEAAINAAHGTGVADSMHCVQRDGFSHALDFTPIDPETGKPAHGDRLLTLCREMVPYIEQAQDELMVALQHGADWDSDGIRGERGEWDWPHWQLPRWPHTRAQAHTRMLARIAARQEVVA